MRKPSFFEDMPADPPGLSPIRSARVLAVLGDSITTDHISPAGAIKKSSPAGAWLIEQGVESGDFNSYGSRRGNYEVMVRGTFANIRLRNLLVEKSGGFTRHFPDGEETEHLRGRQPVRGGRHPAGRAGRQGVRLGLVARLGGQGHHAARCPRGDRRELRADPPFEPDRHGRGSAPVPGRRDVESLGLTGEEVITIGDLQNGDAKTVTVTAEREGAETVTFEATVRLDTPNEIRYIQNGGILQTVLRDLNA